MKLIAIDHVQLAMPEEQEAKAVSFYVDMLGLKRVPKPAGTSSGGAWFENETVKLHLGVEKDFRPARKAHPALIVEDLNSLVTLLRQHGYAVTSAEKLSDLERVHVHDPFGNRIELISAN